MHNLNVNYFIPTVRELTIATEFVNKELDISMEFLNKSILLNNDIQKNLSNLTKEERNRELAFISFLLYGSSRLLKRPSNQNFITKQ